MTKLTEAERRAVAKAALSGASVAKLTRTYGISRARVYQIRDEYTDAEKLAELEDEVAFRRQVAEPDVTRRKGEK